MENNNELKLFTYLEIMNLWLEMRQKGKTIIPFLKSQGYNGVAIYGMQMLGHRLVDELSDSDICIDYVIDKQPVLGEFKLFKPDDELPKTDAIIVTADYYFSEINSELSKSPRQPF